MGIIIEPKGVDFYVVNKRVTEEDKKFVSGIIADYKAKGKKKRVATKPSKRVVVTKSK